MRYVCYMEDATDGVFFSLAVHSSSLWIEWIRMGGGIVWRGRSQVHEDMITSSLEGMAYLVGKYSSTAYPSSWIYIVSSATASVIRVHL